MLTTTRLTGLAAVGVCCLAALVIMAPWASGDSNDPTTSFSALNGNPEGLGQYAKGISETAVLPQ